jgi:hypothetical protein
MRVQSLALAFILNSNRFVVCVGAGAAEILAGRSERGFYHAECDALGSLCNVPLALCADPRDSDALLFSDSGLIRRMKDGLFAL